MKMRKHRIKGVEYRFRHWPMGGVWNRVLAGNGYHRKTFDGESF